MQGKATVCTMVDPSGIGIRMLAITSHDDDDQLPSQGLWCNCGSGNESDWLLLLLLLLLNHCPGNGRCATVHSARTHPPSRMLVVFVIVNPNFPTCYYHGAWHRTPACFQTLSLVRCLVRMSYAKVQDRRRRRGRRRERGWGTSSDFDLDWSASGGKMRSLRAANGWCLNTMLIGGIKNIGV